MALMMHPQQSVSKVTIAEVARHIEHTLLAADTTPQQIDGLCKEALIWKFRGVCVNPVYIERCKALLRGTDILTVTVVGFPLGAMMSAAKAFEAQMALAAGADEVDMVMAVGLFLAGELNAVQKDIKSVAKIAPSKSLKVIIETGLLNASQIESASRLAVDAGAGFVKTCTGFSKGRAEPRDIALIRNAIGQDAGIKASGGIGTYEDASALLAAGATRLGASRSVAIMQGAK